METKKDWKEKLSDEEYHVLRKKGTEQPFSGKYVYNKDKGIYCCKACGNKLFKSDKKFDSKTGWPSFTEPLNKDSVEYHEDNGFLMKRTEVVCKKCKGHLGHVFDDGPGENGKRYCMNSIALDFKKR